VSLLNSHPTIYSYGEVIGESRLSRQYFKKKILALGAESYVNRCFRHRGFEAIGIKILYYQVSSGYAQEWGVNSLPRVLEFLKSDKDIKIIHLKRRNRLRTFVSFRVSGTTEQYRLFEESEKVEDIQIELSPDECDEEFNQIGQWEREFDEAFRHHNTLEVHYEDLVSHRDRECDRILDFLDVRCQPLRTRMLKQTKRPLPEIIANYRELKKHFTSTESEWFFED
jgi:hypothetical protein